MEAFAPEIERALQNPMDFKSALQELLARRGAAVSYEITAEEGPPHDRTYTVTALGGRPGARQRQRPQQEVRRAAGGEGDGRAAGRRARRMRSRAVRLKSLTLSGFKSFPDRTQARLRARGQRRRRAQRLGQVERHRRRAVGARRAVAAGRPRRLDAGRDLRRRPRRAAAQRGRGRGRARQRATARSSCRSARSRSCAASTATARAATGSTVPAAASPTCSRCSPTPAWARRRTRSSRRGGSMRSSPPSRATGGC